MRALRIFVNNIELDYERDDAKIRDENWSFFKDIKVKHSTRPIRIIENESAVAAMGNFTLHNAKKQKFFPCKVHQGAIIYNGVITQKEKIIGSRICDLKYGSEINAIMDQPISSFFPDYSVIGEQVPQEYVEEADDEFNAQDAWDQTASDLAYKIYPEVKWQLPMIKYDDKYGIDLKSGDANYSYRRYLNHRDLDGLSRNTVFADLDTFSVYNTNAIAPKVFVLSPIFYAFQSINYSLSGDVVNSGLFKRMLLVSFNDNMTKIVKRPTGDPQDITTPAWTQKGIPGVLDGLFYQTYVKETEFDFVQPGEYMVPYDFTMSFPLSSPHFYGIQVYRGNILIANFGSYYPGQYKGELRFTVEEGQQDETFKFLFHSSQKVLPSSYSFGISEDLPDVDFYDFHPTVDFSRYIPDWTTADYLNNFAKMFNWKIDIDDVEKNISINFNIDHLLKGKPVDINKSLRVMPARNIDSESFVIKYENDEDRYQFASLIGSQIDENTEILPTKFKYIPYKYGSHYLSETIEDRAGIGLVIYDPGNHPRTSESFNGVNLQIPGAGGIYETFWKPWIIFRLGSMGATLSGPFTHTELYQISKAKKIFVDNQCYMVKSVEYTENSIALFETDIEVQAVTF